MTADHRDVAPLFDRLPEEIFRPLAAPKSRHYWSLFSQVMAVLWGEDGRAPGEELAKSKVIRIIESCLIAEGYGADEDASPVGVQSHNDFNMLKEAGWFSVRKRGLVEMVTVKPRIAMLFTTLSDFARQEPEHLGGQVRSILLNLQAVSADAEDPSACGAFQEAAKQARKCMTHIVNTGCRVQDVMDRLVELDSARDFVRGFFSDFVEQLFIADYSQLRTRNHPLQFRGQIIDLTYALTEEEDARGRLLAWYVANIGKGDLERGTKALESDTRKLLSLSRIEDHLARLDEEISIANQRALALIEYKLRSPRHLDKLISRACAGLGVLTEDHVALPADRDRVHWSAAVLAKPRKALRAQVATGIAEDEPTTEELAMELLHRRMLENRKVSPLQLANYVARVIGDSAQVNSDALDVSSINDLCCYQRLLLIAFRDEAPIQLRKHDPILQMLKGIRVRFEEEGMTDNAYMAHRRFVIERVAA